MVDCDRGVSFGNPGQSTANQTGAPLRYVSEGIIQNNLVTGGADCGIELWHVEGIKVRPPEAAGSLGRVRAQLEEEVTGRPEGSRRVAHRITVSLVRGPVEGPRSCRGRTE